MNSSNAIKSFRGKRLKTQDDIATDLGVSRQVYCSYENNLLNCELTTIFKILNIMEATEIERKELFCAIEQDYLSYKGV